MGIFGSRSNNSSLSFLRNIKSDTEIARQKLAGLSTIINNHIEEINLKELNESILGHKDGLKDAKIIISEAHALMTEDLKLIEGEDEFKELKDRIASNFEAYNAIIENGINDIGLYLNNFERLIESTNGINMLTENVSALIEELKKLTRKIENVQVNLEHSEEKKKPCKRKY